MPNALPELKPTAMRKSVADVLRDALLAGHFAPGESMSEVQLAASLKISRGPVREALLILAEEGLVSHTQNRGFSVFQLTEQDCARISVVVALPI